MIGRSTVILVLLPVFGAMSVHSQHDLRNIRQSVYEHYRAPQVTYQMTASVNPEKNLISGWMDIVYENRSNDTLSAICLDFGFSPYPDSARFEFYSEFWSDSLKTKLTADLDSYCWIDSVLCQAARLSGIPVIRLTDLLEIPLRVSLRPGEKIPLIIAFETKYSTPDDTAQTGWDILSHWFPQVAHYVSGKWQSTSDMPDIADHPLADYRISVSVDSSYSLIAPGELFNEKEHYGTFAKGQGDSVYVDVTASLFAFSPDKPYQPVFDRGIKSFYWQLLDGYNFPLIITKGFHLDRTYAEGLPIEVYYRSDDIESWRRQVGSRVHELYLELLPELGAYPFPKLMLISAPQTDGHEFPREMIALRSSFCMMSDSGQLLRERLIESWNPDILPSSEDEDK